MSPACETFFQVPFHYMPVITSLRIKIIAMDNLFYIIPANRLSGVCVLNEQWMSCEFYGVIRC